jgi:hypothetical protein
MNPVTFALNVSTFDQLAVYTDAISLACCPGDPVLAAYKLDVLSFRASSRYLPSGVENEFFTSSRKYMNTQT